MIATLPIAWRTTDMVTEMWKSYVGYEVWVTLYRFPKLFGLRFVDCFALRAESSAFDLVARL